MTELSMSYVTSLVAFMLQVPAIKFNRASFGLRRTFHSHCRIFLPNLILIIAAFVDFTVAVALHRLSVACIK